MMFENIKIGDKAPEQFNAIIEIPKGSRNKYEFDEETGVIALDRVYYSSMTLPCDYGFIPETRSEDGDHLDVIVYLDHATFPGCVISCKPIGVIYMIDGGEKDEKIVAVATKDPRNNHIESVEELGPHFKKEVQHYFEHYKDLENKIIEIKGWGDRNEALEVIKKSIEK